jgi:methionyl-tRNA formyltransferase
MEKLKLICLFARQLGLETLKGIIREDLFQIKAVFTHFYELDMKVKRPLFEEYVKVCGMNNIPLILIHKNQNSLKILKDIDFDFLISNCYSYKVPDEILSYANIASLNMHYSLLPKYKGRKPLLRALQNKEKKTGTSVHIMTSEFDSGKVIDQYEIPIEEGDDEQSLFKKLYPTQYPLLKRVLITIFNEYEK